MRLLPMDELVKEAVRAATTALGSSPEMSDLQRHLFDSGVNSMVATEVTEQVMAVTRGEAYEAYISSPFRTAERDARQEVLDLLGLMTETRKRQQRLCVEHQVQWTPPRPGSKAGLAHDVGTGLWPVNGLRLPVEDSTCGWYLWAGEGEMDQSAEYFEPVHVGHLYVRCQEVLPYLGLPPGWRFVIAPGYSDIWEDLALLAT